MLTENRHPAWASLTWPGCLVQAFRVPAMAGGHALLAVGLVYQGLKLEESKFSQVRHGTHPCGPPAKCKLAPRWLGLIE